MLSTGQLTCCINFLIEVKSFLMIHGSGCDNYQADEHQFEVSALSSSIRLQWSCPLDALYYETNKIGVCSCTSC